MKCCQAAVKTTYFRRKNKNSYSLNWRHAINLLKIANIISNKEDIPLDNLLFVHKGRTLNPHEPLTTLGHMEIVHVVDLQQTHKENITITLKSLKGEETTYQVPSNLQIRQFICNKVANINTLPYFYIGLVYLGKVMHPKKTFQQELVQDEAEITMVNIKEYIKDKKQKELKESINNISDIIEGGKRLDITQPLNNSLFQSLPFQKRADVKVTATTADSETPKSPPEPEKAQNNNKKQETPDLNQTKYPMSIYQLQLQSRYDGPHNETRLLARLDSCEQNEQEVEDVQQMAYVGFKIKVSQVESEESDQQNRNKVDFNEQDSRSIYSNEILEEPSKEDEISPTSLLPKPSAAKPLGSKDLQIGDLILTDPTFQSQTVNFLDKMVQEYKFMFQ